MTDFLKACELNHPLIIDFDFGKIFGILRGSKEYKRLVILCPSETGTRIGPQRIYVELALELEKHTIASYCADIPSMGDSFDNKIETYKGTFPERLVQHYKKYLQIIIEYFKKEYNFNEIILLSISDGCLPVYNYAKNHTDINSIILLSPNHHLGAIQGINTKNLKQYYVKLFKIETWVKIIFGKLNLKKIIKNIYRTSTKENNEEINEKGKGEKQIGSALVVFAEKESKLKECLDYWEKERHKASICDYTHTIIKGADHSFFGWQFKRDIEKSIINWIGKTAN